MKALVEQHGGKNLAAVSANVDFIVAGDNMGPAKRQKAEKLGVKILSDAEFMALIEAGEATPQEPEPQEQAPKPQSKEATTERKTDNNPVQGTLF